MKNKYFLTIGIIAYLIMNFFSCSDNSTSVSPDGYINILSPADGDIIMEPSYSNPFTVTWNADNNIKVIKIEISFDDGLTYHTLMYGVNNSGYYSIDPYTYKYSDSVGYNSRLRLSSTFGHSSVESKFSIANSYENSISYQPNNGSTIYSDTTSSCSSGLQNIGFDFMFCGTTYTQFTAGKNGVLKLGSDFIDCNSAWGDISNQGNCYLVNCQDRPLIAPLWAHISHLRQIRSLVSGSEPYQSLSVEWIFIDPADSLNNTFSFQTILNETYNSIEFLYNSPSNILSFFPALDTNFVTGFALIKNNSLAWEMGYGFRHNDEYWNYKLIPSNHYIILSYNSDHLFDNNKMNLIKR